MGDAGPGGDVREAMRAGVRVGNAPREFGEVLAVYVVVVASAGGRAATVRLGVHQLVQQHVRGGGGLDDGVAYRRVAGDDEFAAVVLEHEAEGGLHVAVLDLERGGAPAVAVEGVSVVRLDDANVHDVLAHAVVEPADADVLLEGVHEAVDEVPRPRRADDGERSLAVADPAGEQHVGEVDGVVRVHVGEEDVVELRGVLPDLHHAAHAAGARVDEDGLPADAQVVAGPGALWAGLGRACAEQGQFHL